MEKDNLKNMTEIEINNAVEFLINTNVQKFEGNDNSGKPKKEYLKKLVSFSDKELLEECESKIWLSAYANNNPRSDYHWQCDSCYYESKRREKIDIYNTAYKTVSNQ